MSELLAPTPSQTVGPFFHYALPFAGDRDVVPVGSPAAVHLHGVIYDGAGNPIPDALVETWQLAPDGSVPTAHGSFKRDGYTFTGFGRTSTSRAGVYSISTLVPGVPADRPDAAPFFALTVFARGLIHHLFTRAYVPVGFDGATQAALDADPLLNSVPAERRGTLLAVADEPTPTTPRGIRFDIRMQGEGETVFLTYPGL